MTGRTSWWARDAAFHDRELIVELGEEFGPAGPYVIDVLCDMAQSQRDNGAVRTGFRVLSRKTFTECDTVRQIVTRASESRLVDDLVIDPDGRRFTCRISGWVADQRRGRAAERKAVERERHAQNAENSAGQTVTERDLSHDVTESALPDQTINNYPPNPPKGEWEKPPAVPGGSRIRDKAEFDKTIRTYASWLLPDLPEPDRSEYVGMAVRHLAGGQHGAYTHDSVRKLVGQWSGVEVAA